MQRKANTPESLTNQMEVQTPQGGKRLPNGIEIQSTTLDVIRRFAEGGYLYAILDSCDAPAIPERANALGEEVAVSLFKGSAQEDYWAVAPYLFKVPPAILEWILTTFAKEPWGIFLMSKAGIQELQKHLRRFLIAQFPTGERWFFRYYDPRVLRSYLPTCDVGEAGKFFGPVRGYCIPQQGAVTAELFQCPPASNGDPTADQEPSPSLLWPVRKEQLESLKEQSIRQSQERIVLALRQALPKQTAGVSDQHLAAFTLKCIERARVYAMVKEETVFLFAAATLVYGASPEMAKEAAWTREILPEPKISESVKTELLRMHLSFHGVQV